MAIGVANTTGAGISSEDKRIYDEKIQDCNWAITELTKCIGVCGGQSTAQKILKIYNDKKSLWPENIDTTLNQKLANCDWVITNLAPCIGVAGGAESAKKVLAKYQELQSSIQ